jgi:hypothetical protein
VKNLLTYRFGYAQIWVPRVGGDYLKCLIDIEDAALVKTFPNTWRAQWDESSKTYYVVGRQKGKATLIHRLIMDAPAGVEVDHGNHDGLDNRRQNLTLVTRSQNALNRKGARANSSSGVRGVYWHKLMKQWRATVRLPDGKRHEIGGFSSVEEARVARESYLANGVAL